MSLVARKINRFARDLLLYSMAAVLLSGCCLAWQYVPVPDRAFVAVMRLKESVFAGGIVLSVHVLSGTIFLCAIASFILSVLIDKIEKGTKLRLSAVSASLLALGVSGIFTGLILALDDRAISVMHRLFLPSSGQESPMPALFDASSLLFFRIFLVHAAVIPAATIGLLYLLVKTGKPVFGCENNNPVVRRSAWFAAYTTALVLIGYYFKSLIPGF